MIISLVLRCDSTKWGKVLRRIMIFMSVFIWCLLFLSESSANTNVPKDSELKDKRTPVTTATQKCSNIYQSFYAGPNKKIEALLHKVIEQFTDLQEEIKSSKGSKTSEDSRKDCAELYKSGERSRVSGVYSIKPDESAPFDVFCDQTTAGGGWTVFQKRLDGSVDFYRKWAEYERGFGNLIKEYWLGLEKINRLTNSKKYRLRVDLEDTEGNTAYAEYGAFAVSNKTTKYKLTSLGAYYGTAGDSLSDHRGYPFSTKDQDNDVYSSAHCAVTFKGAWWYKSCLQSNLNGLYHHGQHSSLADGVNWHHWKGLKYSAKRAEMKIRPVDF